MSSVLHISCHPNVDRRFIGEMNYLVRRGWEVGFLCTPLALSQSGLNPLVHVYASGANSSNGQPRADLAFKERLIRKIKFTIYRILVSLPFFGDTLLVLGIKALNQCTINTLERNRQKCDMIPDIIHVHDVWLLEYVKRIRLRYYPQAKIIYDCHEFTPFQTPYRVEQRVIEHLERKGLEDIDGVIAVNESIAEQMSKLYAIEKPAVIYNSCEPQPEKDTVSKDVFLSHFGVDSLPEEAVIVLYQGSLSPGKNLEPLIEAFQFLPETIHLFLLGNGLYKDQLQHLVKRKKLSNVHFGVGVPQIELHAYTKMAHLGIIPYKPAGCLNNLLCTPNKLFEFIDAELPILANDLPELSKCLTGWDNGAVCPMDTPEQIVEAVLSMISRLKHGDFTKEKATRVKDAYSFANQMQILEALYEKVLQRPFCSHLRILHLPFNIASKMSITVQALRKRHENALGICFAKPMATGKDLFVLPNVKKIPWKQPFRKLFASLLCTSSIVHEIFKADVVHYYAAPFLPFGADVWLCRLLGKTGLVEFCGSDIRIPQTAMQCNPCIREMYEKYPELLKVESNSHSRWNQFIFYRCGFHAMANADILNCLRPEYFPDKNLTKVRIAIDEYSPRYPAADRKRPLMIHMPSDFRFKGTEYVLEAVKKLQQRMDFEFQLVKNCNHEKNLELLQACDIFLDQFFLGAYGMATVEAMALGKPVVCYLAEEYQKYYPAEIPIVNVPGNKLETALETLLLDGEKRASLGRASRLFVEKYHNADEMADMFSHLYSSLWRKKHVK